MNPLPPPEGCSWKRPLVDAGAVVTVQPFSWGSAWKSQDITERPRYGDREDPLLTESFFSLRTKQTFIRPSPPSQLMSFQSHSARSHKSHLCVDSHAVIVLTCKHLIICTCPARTEAPPPDPRKLITSIQEKDVTPSEEAFIRGSQAEAQLQAHSHWLLINMIFTANY